MKTEKISCTFNISSNYSSTRHDEINMAEIEEFTAKIPDILLSFDEVFKNSCFFEMDFKTLSFDILLTNDDEVWKINRDYRGKDTPTDVITFALFADDDFKLVTDGEIYLGEIIISLDTAKKQAKGGLLTEILTLITHGILHLFGFDHQTEDDYAFVTKIQAKTVETLIQQR